MVNNKLSGKGEKASDRLKAIRDEADDIKMIVGTIADCLANVVKQIGNELEPNSERERTDRQKLRGMISGLPRRIEFIWNGLRFYIDFTLLTPEVEDATDLRGSIVYGANRTLCFVECIFPEEGGCKGCQRITRCDGLEDKPLIQFSVDRLGIIKSTGEIDDEWRIKDIEDDTKNKRLGELHCRALDHIWKDALSWTNENILP